MNDCDWGSLYYDHYESFFKEPFSRNIYDRNDGQPSIQILSYDNVYSGCIVYCTLGVSHYNEKLNRVGEICVVCDSEFDSCSDIIANTVFYLIDNKIKLGWGVSISGINAVDASFCNNTNKVSLYITNPYQLPKGFERVVCKKYGETGYMYWGAFISKQEHDFFLKYGAESIEDHFEKNEIDLFNINRVS